MEEKAGLQDRLYEKRDIRFDVLRFIGLLCIILAHVNPPAKIYEIRNFDVPLMVIISGAVFQVSSSGVNIKYRQYIVKRVLRLIAPTWIFLTLFFIITYFFSVLLYMPYPFSLERVISSFALISGIGYVWIIRVYILTAIVSPLLLKLYSKINNNIKYLFVIFMFYSMYELTYYLFNDVSLSVIKFILDNYIFYILPYGVLVGIGICIPKLTNKTIGVILSTFLIIYLGHIYLLFPSRFISMEMYKWPPRLYYLSYSIFVSLILYLISNNSICMKVFNNKLVLFISSSSLWIYLWHILYLFAWAWARNSIPNYLNNFVFEIFIVLGLASLTTYIQRRLIRWLTRILNVGVDGQKTLTVLFLK